MAKKTLSTKNSVKQLTYCEDKEDFEKASKLLPKDVLLLGSGEDKDDLAKASSLQALFEKNRACSEEQDIQNDIEIIDKNKATKEDADDLAKASSLQALFDKNKAAKEDADDLFAANNLEGLFESHYGMYGEDKADLNKASNLMECYGNNNESEYTFAENENSDRDDSSVAITNAYIVALNVLDNYNMAYVDVAPTKNRLSVFGGKIWEPVDEKQLASIIYSVLDEQDKLELGHKLKSFITGAVYILQQEIFERQKQGIFRFSRKDFSKIDNRAVFNNTIIDVRTLEQYTFDANLPYYMMVDANYVEETDDKHHRKLLMDATGGDLESVEMIIAYEGYLCIPNRSSKSFGYLGTARDSGKSLLGNFLASTISGSITIDLDMLNGRFAVGRCENSNLVTCFELTTKELSAVQVSNLKRFTGETSLRSERKFKDEKDITIRFKVLLAGNGKICLQGQGDDALFRRLKILPFVCSTPVDKCDYSLEKKLYKEKDCIFSNAVRKIGECIDKKNTVHLPTSKLSQKMWEQWRANRGLVELFVDEMLDITLDGEDVLTCEEVYEGYKLYHNKNFRNEIMMDLRHFKSSITNKFPVMISKRRKGAQEENGSHKLVQCFIGMKFKDVVDLM